MNCFEFFTSILAMATSRDFSLYKSVIREQKHNKIHFTNSGYFSVPCLDGVVNSLANPHQLSSCWQPAVDEQPA